MLARRMKRSRHGDDVNGDVAKTGESSSLRNRFSVVIKALIAQHEEGFIPVFSYDFRKYVNACLLYTNISTSPTVFLTLMPVTFRLVLIVYTFTKICKRDGPGVVKSHILELHNLTSGSINYCILNVLFNSYQLCHPRSLLSTGWSSYCVGCTNVISNERKKVLLVGNGTIWHGMDISFSKLRLYIVVHVINVSVNCLLVNVLFITTHRVTMNTL